MSKLALNMIVKDDSEAQLLYRCLSSIAEYVDGIFITATNEPYDKIESIVKSFGGEISYFKWVKSFEKARNYALEQVPEEYDYIIWCDADDVWMNADRIPEILSIMKIQGLTGVFLDYRYEIDPDTGKVNIVHPRERIVKRDHYIWKGHLHETLIPTRNAENGYYKDVKVNHLPPKSASETNMKRNLEILEKTYKDEGKNKDPRTVFYLARQYFDLERHEEAKKLFTEYVPMSGWDEERAQAYNYLAMIAATAGDVDTAIEQAHNAVKEKGNVPAYYVNLAYFHALKENFDMATHYLRVFVNTPQPKSGVVHVPADDELRYYHTLYLVAMGKKKIPEAIEAAKALTDRFPRSQDYRKKYESVVRLQELIDTTEAFKTIVEELEHVGEQQKIQELINSLPNSIVENAYVAEIRKRYAEPKIWPEKSIVYYTGRSFEEWTPESLKTGLGGSETAVIQLAKQWQSKGYKVTVYGNHGTEEGNYDGVEYINWYRFNRWDKFDTLILWRNPLELSFPYSARNIWLDLHDVPNPFEFTKERVERVDKIFVKSKYHRSLLPDIADDKFVIIPNGVDKKFAKLNKGKHDKYKFIYASSYDRGLHWMLHWGWPIIKRELPEATLDIYYGWNLFDSINRNNPERMAWKKEMQHLMKQKGVTEHGRIGQKELLKKKSEASIHYYASNFEEIDCISVRESALVGCVPVMTDYAALGEKTYGVKVEGDPNSKATHEKIARKIIDLVKTGDIEKYRKDGINEASKESWDNIANEWIKSV